MVKHVLCMYAMINGLLLLLLLDQFNKFQERWTKMMQVNENLHENLSGLLVLTYFLGKRSCHHLNGCSESSLNFEKAINTLRAGLIQAVRKKQLIRTWLCG